MDNLGNVIISKLMFTITLHSSITLHHLHVHHYITFLHCASSPPSTLMFNATKLSRRPSFIGLPGQIRAFFALCCITSHCILCRHRLHNITIVLAFPPSSHCIKCKSNQTLYLYLYLYLYSKGNICITLAMYCPHHSPALLSAQGTATQKNSENLVLHRHGICHKYHWRH